MKEHDYYEGLIFCDEPLSETEREELEAHAAACESCRLAIEDWKAVSELLFREEAIAPAPGFAARTENAVANAALRSKVSARRWLLAVVLICVLLSCLSVQLTMMGNHFLMSAILKAVDFIEKARVVTEGIAYLLGRVRTPLLIFGCAMISAAFLIGFGILLSIRKNQVQTEREVSYEQK